MELEQLIKSIEPEPEFLTLRKTLDFYVKMCQDCGLGFPVSSKARWLVKDVVIVKN